ncbi:uncharacterized protein LOC129943330 isoform X2 [Eupeodes corollae]|uniref:uncharacterized protein LOC129943330 isoform X2 n=1 Tax=Eupeodes corollae TaxID=290404 RepID=UPI00248FDFC6|nr:uncharacterized protein LOC129943330 isoform X2 [Eupeodes corollae]
MTRFKIKNQKILTCCLIWVALFGAHLIRCSEFPERECCDLTTTSTVGPLPLPPAMPTEKSVATSSVQTISVGRSGSNIKAAIAILNCILARQLCFEDPSCSAILEIIPRVCGPIPVSCSTVTVTKCQAALRTLQAFQFFRPTCLCKEPGVDPDCNHFRDFLFDHPCGFVLKKEKDPYPIDALPTCNHALSVCQQERKCLKLFEDFKVHCKVRDNKCRMDDREACHDSWTNLRLSPMFGCICPNNHMKKRCDRIFNIVNHNPCVDIIFYSYSGLGPPHLTHQRTSSSETSNSVYLAEEEENLITAEIFSLYPHFLFPPSSGMNRKIPLALASHSPATNDDSDERNEGIVAPDSGSHRRRGDVDDGGGGGGGDGDETYDGTADEADDVIRRRLGIVVGVGATDNNDDDGDANAGTGTDTDNGGGDDPEAPDYIHVIKPLEHESDEHYFQSRKHKNSSLLNVYHRHQSGTGNGFYANTMDERVRIMGMDESYHQRVFEDNMALIDTPLIAPINTHYTNQHHGVITYPFNVSDFQRSTSPTATGDVSIIDGSTSSYQSGQDVEADLSSEIIKQHFQSTCHTALDTCREDPSCSTSLQPMLMHCEMHRCNRNACMNSLQAFYKGPHEDLNLDIAFCLCKKTTNRHDMCMIAQEKLHPVCAQRPPDSINLQNSNGIFYHPPPACHVVADLCKEDRECRIKLEYYEQACAVDSVTKKCAGRPSGCRQAMLGILGTSLRTTCACQGTDSQYLYQCVGWRRLLWMNPCVVEAQKDFHMKRLAELGLLITTTTTTTTTTTLPPPTTTTTKQVPMVLKTPKKALVEVFRQHPTKAKSEPTSVETNYIEQPDSIPETLLHSGNGENGNTGNDDYHGGGGSGSAGGSNGINGDSGISSASSSTNNGNGRTNAANGSKRKANGNGNGSGSGGSNGHHRERTEPEEPTIVILPTTTTERVTTTEPTTTSTTTMMTTTTQAPRNCVAQRPHQSDQLIREGTSKRIYSLDDAECSELCTCGESLTLTCHALCVPFAPCRTALAFYSHASPAYQAFRGRCLCYSGRFICMKPPLGEYTLPGGVFLLLGYSSADEALLRPHTNLGVQDAVRALQQYVTTHIDNQTMCTLTLFNMTDENIIIAARLPHDAKLKAIDLLRKEKEECTNILKTISHHINTEHSELQSHRLLSIFKMSEVEVIWPESSSANSPTTILGSCTLLTSLMFSLLPFVSWTLLKTSYEET